MASLLRSARATPLLVAAVVALAVLGSRFPFAAQTLWAHDSVLYARALEQGFHVDDELRKQRPHPPGYILYVASADVAHAAGLDSNEALVLVSALASALGAAGLYLLARRFVRDELAIIAAVAYAADPFVWQYSEIAYPYTVLGLGSIAIAGAALVARGRGLRAALAATAVFGVAGGFRQDLLILLAPLWLWCVWPLGLRRAAGAAAALVVMCATWLVPTVLLSDGLDGYLGALESQAAYVGETYSIAAKGVPALFANLAMTSYSVGWGLLFMAPLAGAAALMAARRAWRGRAVHDATFALLWCVPPLAFYSMLHIGEWGYVLSALPGLYLVGTWALGEVADALGHRRLVLSSGWAALVVAPALVFVASAAPFSASQIALHDHGLMTRFAYVRDHFGADRTLILTREDFLLVRYYLPDYHARQYDPEPYVRLSRKIRAGHVDRVVVFTPGLSPERAADVRRVACAKGIEFVYLDVLPDTVLEMRDEHYAVASPPVGQ